MEMFRVDISPSDASKVCNLAVYEHCPGRWRWGGYEDWVCDLLRLFNGVEKLTIVVEQLVFKPLDHFPPDNTTIDVPFTGEHHKIFNKSLRRMRYILRRRRQMVDLDRLQKRKIKCRVCVE